MSQGVLTYSAICHHEIHCCCKATDVQDHNKLQSEENAWSMLNTEYIT